MTGSIGRYDILRPLGAGGMGEVFLAMDRALQRQVAIKLLPAAHMDEDAQKRMLREARMVATIDHPNVCTIFEQDPDLAGDLDGLVEPTASGDPDSPLRWTSKSVRHLAAELQSMGHDVSYRLVKDLLHAAGYKLAGESQDA